MRFRIVTRGYEGAYMPQIKYRLWPFWFDLLWITRRSIAKCESDIARAKADANWRRIGVVKEVPP